ncbi:MAG: hypothetical protein AAGD25_26170 [Cyanobacteria bacterium P01_F01_bin.150]
MVINQQLAQGIIAVAVGLAALIIFPVSCWAMDLRDSASAKQTATLVGPMAKAPISLSLRPAPNQPNVGYGRDGDVVTVLEQVADFLPEADESNAWNHIRLNDEPYTEGWIQGKFLTMQETDSLSPQL